MGQTWNATRYEKDFEADVGRWHLVLTKDTLSGWSSSISLSGIPMASSVGLPTPGAAFDFADDFVAAYRPRRAQ